MSVSRRKFLRAGTLVALSAALPVSLFAQSFKDRDGNPGDPQSQPDPLANYNRAAFSSYLNSVFQISTGYSVVAVTLVEVKDLLPAGTAANDGRECFSLVFRGGSRALSQNTYRVEHPSLGRFELFLVPGAPDEVGAQSFVAIINRVSYKDALNVAPSRLPKGTEPKTTDKARPEPPAAGPQTATPAQAPPPGRTIKPAESPKPDRKKKPSWKNDDNPDFSGGIDQ